MREMKQRYHAEIETAIEMACQWRSRFEAEARDGAQIYAYPLKGERIAWGVNAAITGKNICRGVREPNGIDTGPLDDLSSTADLVRRYIQKLQGLSDEQLEREATNMCWQSNYAASREDHDSHWQWQACESECWRRNKKAIAGSALEAAMGPNARRPPPLMIREADTGAHLPVQVLRSAAGYYLGTKSSDGSPYSRESVEYWQKPVAARAALDLGQWTARRHANPPPAEFADAHDAVISQGKGRGR
jgi:hypothetical protein